METRQVIDKLSQIHSRLMSHLPKKFRGFIQETDLSHKRGALVIGPRGVGKTTLLLKNSVDKNILYFSADGPLVANYTLSELAEAAFAEGHSGLIIDEVHHSKDWAFHLKSLYDSYPDKTLWISDSSSLLLKRSLSDLSRRFPQYFVPLMSFREYVDLKYDFKLPVLNPFEADSDKCRRITKEISVLKAFSSYKKEGFRPIFIEGDYQEKLYGIIQKSIFYDVPFFLSRPQENHLRLMKSVLTYLAQSPIPRVNIEGLTREWSVSKDKVYEILEVMEHLGLIHIIRYANDLKPHSKGAKIFLADPTMYPLLEGNLGSQREAILTTMFRQIGRSIYACKDEQKGDFVVDQKSLEVGGQNKGCKKSDFVVRDGIDLPYSSVVPLWVVCSIY